MSRTSSWVQVDGPVPITSTWSSELTEKSGTFITLQDGDVTVQVRLEDEPGKPGSGLVNFLLTVLHGQPKVSSFHYDRNVVVDVSTETTHRVAISGQVYDSTVSDGDYDDPYGYGEFDPSDFNDVADSSIIHGADCCQPPF